MADAEEDNIFEDEQVIIDYAEKEVLSDDDDNTSEEDEASQARRDKKEKKKRKFDEMKEKKISARSSQSSSVATEVADAEGQLELFLRNKGPNVPMDLSEDTFLPLPPRSSAGGNRFVDVIDHAIPSRADLFRAPENPEEGCCSPVVLVISSSARRGCDVINTLSQHLKCKIGKLFAKHFRIQDQIEILKSTHFPVAVGTPNRLHKLVEMGALSLSQTVLLIVDLCEDVKGFNVMSLSDTRNDFYNFMSMYCSPEKQHIKIACIRDDSTVKTANSDTIKNGLAVGKKLNGKTNKNRPGFQKKKY